MQEKTKQSIHLAYVRSRCTFPLRCWQRGISCSCRSVLNLVQEHHVYKYVPVRRIPYTTCRSSRGTLKFGQQLAYLCKLYIPLGNSGMMMMADSSQTRILGKVDGQLLHCLLVALEADSRCAQPPALWARRRFGLKMIGMLLALSASCVFPLHLHVSLPRTYKWLFSLMSAGCLGLRSPAAMTDG